MSQKKVPDLSGYFSKNVCYLRVFDKNYQTDLLYNAHTGCPKKSIQICSTLATRIERESIQNDFQNIPR